MSDTKLNKDNEIWTLLQQYAEQKRFYGKSYPKIPFVFSHNEKDFIVEEIPLYSFNNEGEHRILKIRKKNIGTLEVVKIIAQVLNIKEKDIGYAGLKDKNALTYQHISVPNKAFITYENNLHKMEQIKIIESYLHSNKIKIGHLRGNKFFIRLKKVTTQSFERIKEEVLLAQKKGFPNFFGYQRFGNFGDNYIQALQIKKPPNKQNSLQQLLISSLQSVCFNLWLEERLKISNIMQSFNLKDSIQALSNLYNITMDREIFEILHKQTLPLTPLLGDVCMHYPYGKFFYFEDKRLNELNTVGNVKTILDNIDRLKNGSISITGLLSGIDCKRISDSTSNNSKVILAKQNAYTIEQKFAYPIMANGTRRYAWIYPSDLNIKYNAEKAQAEITFILPSGAYATSFLSYIKNGDVREF